MLTNLGRLPSVFSTGESQLPGDEYTRESRLLGSEYTGESITNSNNSSNIRKNSKTLLGVSNGTRRRCLMKKTRVKKSRDTVPLTKFVQSRLPINNVTTTDICELLAVRLGVQGHPAVGLLYEGHPLGLSGGPI